MSVILKYLEWLSTSPEETYWVYDLCSEMPHWDDEQKDYVCTKKIKRIDAKRAREVIKKERLICVYDDKENGRIYA